MQRLHKILVLLFIAALISCQYDPYAHKYTTIKPKRTKLTGTYIFKKQTVVYNIKEFKDSINNQIVIPKIEINSDGTYRVINLPIFENFNPTFTGLTKQTGKWEISTVGSIDDGNGNLKTHWGIHFEGLTSEI